MAEPPIDSLLLQKLQQFIGENQLMSPKDSVLIAISGGPDSVYLAWALKSLGYDISLAHVNYNLRDQDSKDEEALVRSYAEQWGVPVYIKSLSEADWREQKSDSLQMYARKVRYEFFDRLLEETSARYCATAHHADDQVENLLLSLMKGNSFSLFSPIPVKRGAYIRPLLGIRKEEILQELSKQELAFSQDYTNTQSVYQRNRIRNHILPEIYEVNPNFSEHLANRYSWFRSQEKLLFSVLEKLYEEFVEEGEGQNFCNISAFQKGSFGEHEKVFLGYCLMKWGIHGTTFQESLKLLQSESSKKVPIAADTFMYKTRDGILLEKISYDPDCFLELSCEKALPLERKLFGKNIIVTKNNTVKIGKDPQTLTLDQAKVFFPIRFRGWKEGDKMTPLGMKGQKKLSDIFIDEKYDPSQKKRAIVIESGGEIIGLSGFRISEQVKVDFRTSQVLSIRISE